MNYIIDPAKFSINENSRLCLKNMNTNEFEDLIIIKKGKKYNLIEKFKNANSVNYKFKFQTKSADNKWKNATGYFSFLNHFPVNLERFWMNNINYDNTETRNMVDFYIKFIDFDNNDYLINAFNKVVVQIEKSPISALNNIKKYIEYTKSINYEIPKHWKNINLYLEHLYNFRSKILELKLGAKSFLELRENTKKNNLLNEFLENEITVLKEYNLEFTEFLAGKYYSFFDKRKEAADCFKKYMGLDKNLVDQLHMSRGITTYYYIEKQSDKTAELAAPKMLENVPEIDSDTVVLLSVDEGFFRKYGIQLLFNIIALKRHHFHFHIVGEESTVDNLVTETKELFVKMKQFYISKMEITHPTFSTETLPDFVKQETTYYACSRFIHADYFMETFNKNILVIDADYTVQDDFSRFFKEIQKLDIGMSIRNARACMSPWTRFMGGSVFFKNNMKARKYVRHLKEYVLEGISYENSWILDQNALCYASEMVLKEDRDFNIQNIPYDIKPFKQTQIRYYIEGILPK